MTTIAQRRGDTATCRRCRGPVSWEYRHGIGWGWWTVIPGLGLTAHCFPFGRGGNADQLHEVLP